jgi:hypothetical protein
MDKKTKVYRQLSESFSLLSGAARKSKFESIAKENSILYCLARFGWLTSHQIGALLYSNQRNQNEKARKVLKRMCDGDLVSTFLLKRSPAAQMRAWQLTRLGMRRLQAFPNLSNSLRITSVSSSVMDEKYCYHRLITNQALIDMHLKLNKLPFSCNSFITEHEQNSMRHAIVSEFGCLPDSLVFSGEEIVLVETENSCRGIKRQFSKLTHFEESFIDRVHREGSFSGHFLRMGSCGRYRDLRQLFVCTSEKNFRSIWRKVEKIMVNENQRIHRHIYYAIMPNQRWINPLKNISVFEHNACKHLVE